MINALRHRRQWQPPPRDESDAARVSEAQDAPAADRLSQSRSTVRSSCSRLPAQTATRRMSSVTTVTTAATAAQTL